MADYTTVQIVRQTIGSQVSGDDDATLTRLITAVSRQIDHFCGRKDGFVASATASTRLYGGGNGDGVLAIDECIAVTLVETRESVDTAWTAWAGTDWLAYAGSAEAPDYNATPYTALAAVGTRTWTRARRGMMGAPLTRVTARWGFAAAVPDDIANACVIQVARMFKRGKSSYADTLAGGDFGSQQYRRLDPEVEAILKGGRYIKLTI